jgi:amino acid adenylation domain-containing protein/non-ribosomal peptide synthase protein (TIGR01720 family)
VRARLLRLRPTEHLLAIFLHHIVSDGWSVGIITGELGELYTAALRGEPADLPEPPLQYGDYAVWQRDRLTPDRLDAQLAYWRAQLDGIAPVELPTDRPRPAVQTRNGAHLAFPVSAELTARLGELGRRHGASLFMTLAAACQLLFSRYSGQPDVAVGTAVSSRNSPELEHVVGFFVNNLVLRSTVDESVPFTEFLARVRDTALDAFSHADVPFEVVVDEVAPARDPSRPPLFQILVLLQNTPQRPLELPGVVAEPVGLPSRTAQLDLTVQFYETAGGLQGVLGYNTDLFDATTVERLAEHLGVLLDGIVAQPDRPMDRLPWWSDGARERVLRGWNATAVPRPADRCLPDLISEHAGGRPDAIAVRDGDRTVTYGELEARANRLGHHLRTRGVGPDVLVGVCAERGIDFVVGVLGVLRAGGGYVPLDPEYPAARLEYMFADTAGPVLLTQSHLLDRLPAHRAAPLCLDRDLAALEDLPATPPTPGPRPEHLAYAIYTSGSTGRPKGVAIEHRSLTNAVLDVNTRYRLGPDSRVLSFSSMSFDGGVWDLFTSLVAGGTLVLTRARAGHDPMDLVDQLRADRITAVSLPPAVVAALDPADLPELTTLGVAGDVCPPELARAWSAGRAVFNIYGPSECTLVSTMHRADPDAGPDAVPARLPIGSPMANVRLYVLDRWLRPVPVGVPGELYIAGAGLGRGFVNRPAPTAQRFVANPFDGPGERLYRSGDLVRWRPDGELEFVARTDEQVKIRGFRVEPGEVESTLLRHPELVEATVAGRRDEAGRRRLVGYVVPRPGGGAPSGAELREFAGRSLPSYMVPSAFVVLDRLPLNPSGKVDRHALPEPDATEASTDFVAPAAGTEQVLADIWAAVLAVERVGAEDNFFELGGDSILSIQVVSRARQAGLRVLTRDVFTHQTVRALATVTTRDDRAAEVAPVVGEVPLTPSQRWFFDTHRVAPHHFAQSMLVELADGVDERALRTALDALVAQHDALRMRFTRTAQGWRQDNAPVEPVAVAVHELPRGAAVPVEVTAALRGGLDLAVGPPLAAALFTAPGERTQLFLTVHHLVVDSVSWRILLEDLDTAYAQAARGDAVDLGPKTASFRDWSHRLVEHTRTGGFDADLAHWTALPPGAPIPVDGDGPATVATTRRLQLELTEAETTALLLRAPAVYRTRVNEVLLSALSWALVRWTGRDTAQVLLEGHGREELFDDLDLTRTVGWFTAAYPVALTLPPGADPSAPELVRSVRRQLRAIPHNGLSHGALRHLSPPGSPGAALADQPEPRVVFNYHGRWDDASGAAGATLYHAFRDVGAGDECPDELITHPVEIVGSAAAGRLRFTCHYSTSTHRETTVATLVDDFTDALRRIARHCAGGPR